MFTSIRTVKDWTGLINTVCSPQSQEQVKDHSLRLAVRWHGLVESEWTNPSSPFGPQPPNCSHFFLLCGAARVQCYMSSYSQLCVQVTLTISTAQCVCMCVWLTSNTKYSTSRVCLRRETQEHPAQRGDFRLVCENKSTVFTYFH